MLQAHPRGGHGEQPHASSRSGCEWLDEADAREDRFLLVLVWGSTRRRSTSRRRKLLELQTKARNEIGRIIGGLQKFFINNGQQPKK
ncbi:MAG: hypothetical protein ACLSH1_04500 [Clostridia bacterium]